MIVFGPVPSRRLGRSLGINHVPAKVCTYACVYCHVGRTTHLRTRRCRFLEPAAVRDAVQSRVEAARSGGERIDYLTFVPDGEPTLDERLGRMIESLRFLGIPIAVITNGSLLHEPALRAELLAADLVSLKIDAVDERGWRLVNRPHRRLRLDLVLQGIRNFAGTFRGELVSETMLVGGLNDGESTLVRTAAFVGGLGVARAYLAVPTRPPAESWVAPASAAAIIRAWEIFRALAAPVELLVGYDGDDFTPSGRPREDLLAIAAVHPMREHAVERFLRRSAASPDLLDELLSRGELLHATYGGHRYFIRPPRRCSASPETKAGP